MEGDPSSLQKRKRHDDLIRKSFYILLIIFLLWIVFSGFILRGRDLFTFINSVLSVLITILFIIGFLAFYFYKGYGLIKTKQIFKILTYASIFFTLITFILGYAVFRPVLLPILRGYMPGMDTIFEPLVIFIIFFISYVFAFIVILIQGFGLVSVVVMFQRKYFSKVLEDIKMINDKLDDNKDFFERMYFLFLRWVFDIPNVLKSSEINIDGSNFKKNFSWEKFKKAFILETLIAFVIAIYISLNPILLQERSLSELFTFASTLSYFIPVMVLPLFIFLKLQVKIPGPANDFDLFDGIKSRLLSLILALGTIIFFIRLAIETVNYEVLFYSFIFYFVGFLINAFFITFVYFNYFENCLAVDIMQDLKR